MQPLTAAGISLPDLTHHNSSKPGLTDASNMDHFRQNIIQHDKLTENEEDIGVMEGDMTEPEEGGDVGEEVAVSREEEVADGGEGGADGGEGGADVWMNGGQRNGTSKECEPEPNGTFSTKDDLDDPVTMVISPDLPFHLLSPSPEDIEDMEEDLEAEDYLEAVDDEGNDDGKVYTDSLSEMCLCVCKVCNTKMKFNSLREHVRIQHNLRMTEYKLKYGKIAYSRMTYHRCKACGKVLRAIYATIKKHLQTVHALSFKEYANRFSVFKGKFDKVEDIHTTEDKVYSDDPSQMCMTVCKVCNMNLEPYNMKNHVKGKHYLSMLEYKTNFGEIKFITEIYHKCKVCHKCVLFEYQKLSNHMFFNHGIGIAKYKDFLLGKLSLGSLKQMEAEAMKSKSTKNGSHEDARSKSYGDDVRHNKAKRLRTTNFNGGYNPYSAVGHQNLFLLPGTRSHTPSHVQPSLALLQSLQDTQKYFHTLQEKPGMQQLLENYHTLVQNQMLIQQTLAAKAASNAQLASGSGSQLAAAQALLLSSLASRGSDSSSLSSGRSSSGSDAASLLASLASRGSSGGDAAALLSSLAGRGGGGDAAALLSSLAGRGGGGDAAAFLSSFAGRGGGSEMASFMKNYADEKKKFESSGEDNKSKQVSSP